MAIKNVYPIYSPLPEIALFWLAFAVPYKVSGISSMCNLSVINDRVLLALWYSSTQWIIIFYFSCLSSIVGEEFLLALRRSLNHGYYFLIWFYTELIFFPQQNMTCYESFHHFDMTKLCVVICTTNLHYRTWICRSSPNLAWKSLETNEKQFELWLVSINDMSDQWELHLMFLE